MSKSRTSPGGAIPAKVRPAYDEIVGLIEELCRARLNEEYAGLCRKLVGVLARKRPSPLERGKPQTWACAIVRVIGWVNFLDDSSQTPHMKMAAIDEAFGVSPATGATKSKSIRDLLKVRPFDVKWTLPSKIGSNPAAWMIKVNGLILDARYVQREIQEEAFRLGLIPYIPADQKGEGGP
jgi:hypothetical protein